VEAHCTGKVSAEIRITGQLCWSVRNYRERVIAKCQTDLQWWSFYNEVQFTQDTFFKYETTTKLLPNFSHVIFKKINNIDDTNLHGVIHSNACHSHSFRLGGLNFIRECVFHGRIIAGSDPAFTIWSVVIIITNTRYELSHDWNWAIPTVGNISLNKCEVLNRFSIIYIQSCVHFIVHIYNHVFKLISY